MNVNNASPHCFDGTAGDLHDSVYCTSPLPSVVRGASKIKLKKVNKKRTVTVRRVIIFLNISRRPLLICLQCCLHQYKTLKAVIALITEMTSGLGEGLGVPFYYMKHCWPF